MLYEKLTQELDTLIRSFISVDEGIRDVDKNPDILTQKQRVHISNQVATFKELLTDTDV